MIKLPPGEALQRKQARSKATNVKRRQATAAKREADAALKLSKEQKKELRNERERAKRAAAPKKNGRPIGSKSTTPSVKTNPRKRIPAPTPNLCKTKAVPIEERTKIWIPEIRAHVYLRDAESEQACRDRYINRPGSRVGKW